MDNENMARRMNIFESKNELDLALFNRIMSDLSHAITTKNYATLLLSGGSTPKGLLKLLSNGNIDWSKVTVGLVDERFVPASSDSSNEKLLRDSFLINKAKKSTFIPMVFQINNVIENLQDVERAYSVFKTCDVIILGMGEDGHTASLFPDDLNSELAFETSDLVVSTNAPKMPILRISCSPFLLNSTSNLYLMITGRKKKMILDKAIELKLPLGEFIPRIKEIYYTDKEL